MLRLDVVHQCPVIVFCMASKKANDFGYRLDTLEIGFLNKDSKANHSLSFIDF